MKHFIKGPLLTIVIRVKIRFFCKGYGSMRKAPYSVSLCQIISPFLVKRQRSTASLVPDLFTTNAILPFQTRLCPSRIVHTSVWHIGPVVSLFVMTLRYKGVNDSIATVCSLLPRQNTIWFYYVSSLCLFLSPLSFSPNQDRPSMFKTHYMWPSGIYSGTLPVTPFCAGVPWEHSEMSSSEAWKRWREWDGGDWATLSARETEWNLLEINSYGYLCSSNWDVEGAVQSTGDSTGGKVSCVTHTNV